MNRDVENLTSDLRKILGFTVVGGVRWPNVVLAQRHAHEWQAITRPPTTDERGGSSSPTEVAERQEDRRVAIQAQKDAAALLRLIPAFQAELVLAGYQGLTPELCRVAEDLARVVGRCVSVIDHDRLVEVVAPECRSCARSGKVGSRQYQGHKAVPVYEKAPKRGLCRWCYDFQKAEGRLPPIDVVDIYHRVGSRAAGLELARRLKKAS